MLKVFPCWINIKGRKKEIFSMKRTATLVMGLTAVMALVACNNGKGTEVKAEEFKEKSAQIEEHQYSEATVKYSLKSEYKIPNFITLDGETGPLDGETGPLDGETGPLEESGEVKFTFSNGEWAPADKDAPEMVESMIGVSLKDAGFDLRDLTGEFEAMASQYGVKGSLKYYVNPFGVELAMKGDINDKETSATGKVDVYEYIAFDKYGFVSQADAKVDISSSMSLAGKTMESKIFVDAHITISYK